MRKLEKEGNESREKWVLEGNEIIEDTFFWGGEIEEEESQ